MDEKSEREDNDSGDYADCDCVIEWQGGNSLEWICAAGGGGGDKNSLEWISCSFLLIVILNLCIYKYFIDGIVRRKFRKRFQFYKNYKVCYSVVMQGEVGRGSQ